MILSDLQHIPGFEGDYSASKDGFIFSHKRNRVLKPNIHKNGYLSVMLRENCIRSVRIMIHRIIAATFIGPCPDGFEVDHCNRIKSDNSLINLRYVARGFNMHNVAPKKRRAVISSTFKGVSHCGRPNLTRPWIARIRSGVKRLELGCFATEKEAALAYDQAAQDIYGDTASTNKPLGLL